MKKFAVILMALVMSLMILTSACAAQKMFVMTTVTDTEGNILVTVNEDGAVVDAEGNDLSEEFPVMIVLLDDEAMTCTYGTEDDVVTGTMEIVEQVEDGVALKVTFEDGEEIGLIYTVAGINAVTYVDEDEGMLFIMPEIPME